MLRDQILLWISGWDRRTSLGNLWVFRTIVALLIREIAFGVAMSVVAVLIHSAVDLNLQNLANTLTIVVILAMGWVAHALQSSASWGPLIRD